MSYKNVKYTLFLFIICFYSLYAEEDLKDSIKTYKLGEILTITGLKDGSIYPSTINEIQYYEIKELDVSSLSELSVIFPSTNSYTNSRGETLMFLRGAGARQLGLFFDGAQLNIPWDNRIDLSFIPADIIGNVKITGNTATVLYGANIIGGAIDISTIEKSTDGISFNINSLYSDDGAYKLSFTNDGRFGNFNYVINSGYRSSPGFFYSENGEIPGNQNPNSALRTNSSMERLSAYIRAEYKFNGTTAGLSVNHINGSKGVSPETHLPEDNARFWKYPDWKRTIVTFNGSIEKKSIYEIKSTFWLDMFSQQLDQYKDISYNEIKKSQFDDDLTIGSRISFTYCISETDMFRLAFNGLKTNHNEKIKKVGETTDNADYEQSTISLGGEYHKEIANITVNAGAAYDMNRTPVAGPFGKGEDINDYGLFTGLNYALENSSVFFNLSRKTRFPTMREAYSNALDKFIVNPDLKSETGFLSEIGYRISQNEIKINIALFANFYDDLIVKQTIAADSLNRFTRANLTKARTTGLEFTGTYYPVDDLEITAMFTWLYAESNEVGEWKNDLEYKPVYLASAYVDYDLMKRITVRAEAFITGPQKGLDAVSKKLTSIEPYILLNTRISYKMVYFNGLNTEFFVRVNNISDSYNLPKLGLPGPGRTFLAGIDFLF